MKYSFEIDNLLCNGSPNVPGFAVTAAIEGVLMFYNDINATTETVTHDWMREYIKENREEWDALLEECLDYRHTLKDETDSFNQDSGQTEGMFLFSFLFIVVCFGFFVFIRFIHLHLFILILNVYN